MWRKREIGEMMTKDEALRLALEALVGVLDDSPKVLDASISGGLYEVVQCRDAITAIKAALEAKDEKANDELRRLHDLLGKANALARIRANKIDELEQRLTKTEAQLGEAVWNYGELKREQLANQQKTSGSPINTSTALEAKDEPVAIYGYCPVCGAKGTSRERHPDGNTTCVNGHKYKSRDTLSAPPQQEAKDDPVEQPKVRTGETNELNKAYDALLEIVDTPEKPWVGLTYKERCELWNISSKFSPDSVIMHDFAKDIELALREKNYDRND